MTNEIIHTYDAAIAIKRHSNNAIKLTIINTDIPEANKQDHIILSDVDAQKLALMIADLTAGAEKRISEEIEEAIANLNSTEKEGG